MGYIMLDDKAKSKIVIILAIWYSQTCVVNWSIFALEIVCANVACYQHIYLQAAFMTYLAVFATLH